MSRIHAVALVLFMILSLIPYAAASPIAPRTIGYKALETTSYSTIFIADASAERTGNMGAMTYSWTMDAYIVSFTNETNPTYNEGELYAYIINASGYEQALGIDTSGYAYGADTVVAGRTSFLIGYSRYGGTTTRTDAYAALIRWDSGAGAYTYTAIPLGTTSGYEEYVAAAYMLDGYLTVFYNGSDEKLYGVIVWENASTTILGEIAYTGLAYDSTSLGFTVIAGYGEWLVAYTKSDGYIYYRIIRPDGYIGGEYQLAEGSLYTAHGGAYTYGAYIVPFNSSTGAPSIAILDRITWEKTVIELGTSGSFPMVVEGNRYALAVWKDTASDANGNVYARLVYPLNKSVSDIIDIGRDTEGARDDHIFATYNYAEDVYVITWSSERTGDPDRRVYVATLSEAGSLGNVSRLDISSLTGPFYPHGVASGRDGRVYVSPKYYPDSQSDAYLVYGDLGSDVALPSTYPSFTDTIDAYFLPEQGIDARDKIVELICSAETNVSVAAFQLGYSTTYRDFYVASHIVEAMVKASYRLGSDNVYLVTDGEFADYYAVTYLSHYIRVVGDDSPYYMHHKSIVVDNRYIVVSTANFDRYEFLSDRNIVLLLDNTDIARRFTAEHREMINGTFHGGEPTAEPGFTTLINGTLSNVWVYFSPDDYPSQKDTIRNLIQSAAETIYLAMYHFTDDDIAGDLVAAHGRGVDVKAIFEAGKYWEDEDIHDYDTLLDNGVLATLDKDNADPAANQWYPYFHVKMMIIDHEIVYIGSAQFTTNGFQYNDEHLLIIENPQLASKLEEFFNHYWSLYTGRISVEASYTNGTAAPGVRVETIETYGASSYTRTGVTGAGGEATLYLVYPYQNTSTTGNYTVTATLWGITAAETVAVATGSTATAAFKITGTSITATGPLTINVGETASYTVTLINQSTGSTAAIDTSIDVYINDTYNATITLSGGTGSFTISLDTPGTYVLGFRYSGEALGNEIILKSNTSLTVTVEKNATEIKIYTPATAIDENQSFTITLKLVDGDGEPVPGETVSIAVKQGDTTLYSGSNTTGSDGTASFTIPGLLGGTYTIEASYAGSSLYEASSNTTTLFIRYGTKILVEAPSTIQEDTVFTVYARLLRTVTQDPVAGATLTLTVPGTTIAVSNTTNATGWAVFRISIPDPGSYTIIVSYTGDATYMGSSGSSPVTVTAAPTTVETAIVIEGPSTGKVYETLSYTVRLVNKTSGETLDVETLVRLYVNGTYIGDVGLVGGVGGFTVKPRRAGLLNITLVYDGEASGGVTYLGSSNTSLVDIVERLTTITITAPETAHIWDTVSITITLRDENGTPLPGETLTLYINTTPVTLTTGADGTASYTVKPAALGDIALTATYPGAPGVYSGATASATITVEKRPAPRITADARYEEINETHINLTITGTVRDSLNNTPLDGWIRVYVDKGAGWEYVGNTSVVNGEFTFNAVVDPVAVRLSYVPPEGSETYYESGGGVTLTVSGPPPAPEPPLLPLLLLAAIILFAAKKKR